MKSNINTLRRKETVRTEERGRGKKKKKKESARHKRDLVGQFIGEEKE